MLMVDWSAIAGSRLASDAAKNTKERDFGDQGPYRQSCVSHDGYAEAVTSWKLYSLFTCASYLAMLIS